MHPLLPPGWNIAQNLDGASLPSTPTRLPALRAATLAFTAPPPRPLQVPSDDEDGPRIPRKRQRTIDSLRGQQETLPAPMSVPPVPLLRPVGQTRAAEEPEPLQLPPPTLPNLARAKEPTAATETALPMNTGPHPSMANLARPPLAHAGRMEPAQPLPEDAGSAPAYGTLPSREQPRQLTLEEFLGFAARHYLDTAATGGAAATDDAFARHLHQIQPSQLYHSMTRSEEAANALPAPTPLPSGAGTCSNPEASGPTPRLTETEPRLTGSWAGDSNCYGETSDLAPQCPIPPTGLPTLSPAERLAGHVPAHPSAMDRLPQYLHHDAMTGASYEAPDPMDVDVARTQDRLDWGGGRAQAPPARSESLHGTHELDATTLERLCEV